MGPAVVLVSGGLDSATVLAIATARGLRCHALSVDYGQRHRAELAAAAQVARSLGAAEHRVVRVNLDVFGGSALTDSSIDVPRSASTGIPVTYVPARNTIFLALALAHAEVIGADAIFTGANAVDYSGYPDCRPEYLAAFEYLATLATRAGVSGRPVEIWAPLVTLTKGGIVRRAAELGLDFSLTLSCYQPGSDGIPCGHCDACLLRSKGFEEAGIVDPSRQSLKL